MPKIFFRKLKLTNNKKSVAKISTGTIAGQIISVITLPIITRIYGAEILGLWALMNSITLIINSFSDLGLTNSLMIKSEEEIEKIYKVVSTISFVISIIIGIILTYFYDFFVGGTEFSRVFFMCYLIVASFMAQQTQICYTWLNRNGNYNLLMKNPIIHNISYGILAITLGGLGFKNYGYFISYVLAQIITLLNMKLSLPKVLFTTKITDIKSVLSNSKKFLAFQTPTNILSIFQSQLPTFLIKIFWNTEILGYYSITVKVLKIPVTFLAKAIGRVFFQVTSKMKIEGKNVGEFVSRNLIKNMRIAIIPIVLLMSVGDKIIVIVLGQDWMMAGELIRILSLQYYFMFIMGTVQGLSITLDKQHFAMIANLMQIIGYIIGAIIGKFVFDDIYIAMIIMSALFILVQIVYFSALFKVMNASSSRYLINVVLSISLIVLTSLIVRKLIEIIFPNVL